MIVSRTLFFDILPGMTPEAIILIAAFGAMLIAFTGGGFNSRWINVPPVKGVPRWLIGIFGFILVVCGVGAVIYPKLSAHETSLYAVRVVPLDPDGNRVNCESLSSSVGGTALAFPGGCEFRIPSQDVPKSRTVIFRAKVMESFLLGFLVATLDKDHHPVLTMHLYRDTSGVIRGTVIDESGLPINGAVVWVEGYPSTTTETNGNFTIAAHAANGQFVKLLVSKGGKSIQNDVIVSSSPLTVDFENK
jgi:hypothetical protein